MLNSIIIAVVLAASVASSLWYTYEKGYSAGQDALVVEQKKNEDLINAAVQKAHEATIDAISNIRIVNKTIRQEVQREIQTNTIYRECKHSPEQLQRLNKALDPAAKARPDGEAGVSSADPTP